MGRHYFIHKNKTYAPEDFSFVIPIAHAVEPLLLESFNRLIPSGILDSWSQECESFTLCRLS
jgi:hypothetical protein